MAELPDKSVHCIVTSPPYWGLRSYHLATWEGGDPECDHEGKPLGRGEHRTVQGAWDRPSRMAVPRQPVCMKCGAIEVKQDGGIGLEPTFDEHLDNLMQVFDECWRVLRDDGTVWLNYGDAYAGGGRGGGSAMQLTNKGSRIENIGGWKECGFKQKDLMLMPARIAIALQERGWYLRSEIIWAKPNPMPESCTDRPTNAHEKIFLLSKKKKYFYDSHAVKTKPKYIDKRMDSGGMVRSTTHPDSPYESCNKQDGGGVPVDGLSNLRNVWKLPIIPYMGAHFATFPLKLIEPCIKAGTSEGGCCSECGNPYIRQVVRPEAPEDVYTKTTRVGNDDLVRNRVSGENQNKNHGQKLTNWRIENPDIQTGWKPSCECGASKMPCTVLDPFGGSGTVSVMSEKLDRNSIICEISGEYADMAKERILAEQLPLFASKVTIIESTE